MEAIIGGGNVVPPLCKIVDPLHVIAGRECGPKLTCTAIGKLQMGMQTLRMRHVCIVLPPPVMIPPFGSTCAAVKESTAGLSQATLRCKGAEERMQHGGAGAQKYFSWCCLIH